MVMPRWRRRGTSLKEARRMFKGSFWAVSLFFLQTSMAWSQVVNPGADSQFNWNATTGLINIPIARTLRPGAFFGAFDFKSRNVQSLFGSEFLASGTDGNSGDLGNGSFHFMFSPLRNFEVGVLGLHDVNRGGNVNSLGRLLKIPPAKDFSTALKLVVMEEDENLPSIAVGVENLTHPRNGDSEPNARFFQQGFYAVASKSFPIDENQIVSVHLGAGTGRFQNRPFGGIEYALDNGLALLAEYDGFRSAFGVRYTGLRNLRATVAVQGGRPTFQIGYTFNPFDLISDGDQYDYSPFAKPIPATVDPAEDPGAPAPPGSQPEPPAEPVPAPEPQPQNGSIAGSAEARVAHYPPVVEIFSKPLTPEDESEFNNAHRSSVSLVNSNAALASPRPVPAIKPSVRVVKSPAQALKAAIPSPQKTAAKLSAPSPKQNVARFIPAPKPQVKPVSQVKKLSPSRKHDSDEGFGAQEDLKGYSRPVSDTEDF